MKNFKRKIAILATIACTCLLINNATINKVYASEGEDTSKVDELIKQYPSFEKSLKENTNQVCVGSSEVYVKLTPKNKLNNIRTYKENEMADNYYVEYYTPQEYNIKDSIYNRISTYGIGNMESSSCSWLSLNLQVYKGNGQSDYMAYNFCSWKTSPKFRFTDGIGISVSNGLIVSNNKSLRAAEYQYANPYNDYGGITTYNQYNNPEKILTNSKANGVVAAFSLNPASVAETFDIPDYHNFMIQTGINYNSTIINKGWITGNYLHKEIGFGSISISPLGTPSVSGAVTTDSHSGSIYVDR